MTIDKKPKKVVLSASRMELAQECSWKYYCRYVLRLPDDSNDGAKRGTVTHLILEVLLNPRHAETLAQILKEDNLVKAKSILRLTYKTAKKLNVHDPENLDMIHGMIMVGLRNNFKPEGATITAEEEFKIETDEYSALGYIDKKVFKDGQIEIWDYKTSKKKFTKKELESKHQSLLYSLDTWKRHKIIPKVKYLFLRYPKAPVCEAPVFSEAELQGYEYYLIELSKTLTNFTFDKAISNMAVESKEKRWLCGAGSFVCPYKNPLIYYSVFKDDELVRSAFKKEEIVLKDGEIIKKMSYLGCPAFNPVYNDEI